MLHDRRSNVSFISLYLDIAPLYFENIKRKDIISMKEKK